MKINKLSLYKVNLEAWGGESRYSPCQVMEAPLETNILKLETDSGLVAWGENCTAPPFYLPTLSAGTREAIRYVAPLLLGAEATSTRAILENIQTTMRGHNPAKAAIDMALWDLAGKAYNQPLVNLWGGRIGESREVLAMVSIGNADETVERLEGYRAEGYRTFQIKIGLGDPTEDIEKITRVMQAMQPGERCWFDVNRGWTVDKGMQVLPHVKHLAPLIEQPCETYRECQTLSQRSGMGFMLDELIEDQDSFIKSTEDGVMDVAVLKMGCTGGISQHRHLVEIGLRLGVPMRIEDFYGTGLTLAAVSHLAFSVPEAANFGLYDYHMPDLPVVKNPLRVQSGKITIPQECGPGLGTEVNEDILGDPVFCLT